MNVTTEIRKSEKNAVFDLNHVALQDLKISHPFVWVKAVHMRVCHKALRKLS